MFNVIRGQVVKLDLNPHLSASFSSMYHPIKLRTQFMTLQKPEWSQTSQLTAFWECG